MSSLRVLIVDDNDDVRLLLWRSLALEGIDCREAACGMDALDALEKELPDLVLLDVQMPDLAGWDVLERIRAAPATRDLPVVMCTVKSSPENLVRAWSADCDGYVTKPFDLDLLVSTIKSVCTLDVHERLAARARARGLALEAQARRSSA